MVKSKTLLGNTLALVILITGGACCDAEDAVNGGEDLTQPVDRFDLRMQVESLPDVTRNGDTFDDITQETLTLRTDLLFLTKPDQLALRFDLPLEWNNKPINQNPNGSTDFGMGDFLAQVIYVRTFDPRWAGGFGLRTILPTATGEGFGSGKWQLVPTIGARAMIPEISEGSYAGLIARQFNSVAGQSSRKNINKFQIEPQFNINLPGRWFVNCSPELTLNLETNDWFIPLDIMIGKKFGSHWIASLEYQYGLVRDDDVYQQWLEARIGYFF